MVVITTIFNKWLNMPSSTGGLSLGIAGIAAVWLVAFPQLYFISYSFILLAFLLAIGIWIKFCKNYKLLISELSDPFNGAVIPPSAMAMMIVSMSVSKINALTGLILWLVAIIFHIFCASVFAYHRILNFNINQFIPTWFVPPIGIATAAITAPKDYDFSLLIAQPILSFAIFASVIMLPIMQYRLLLGKRITRNNRPSIALLAAPPNMCLAAYLSIIDKPQAWAVFSLFGISLFMTVCVYLTLFTILRQQFTLSFASLTFPAGIGAVASHKTAQYLQDYSIHPIVFNMIYAISLCELLLSSAIVSYVALCYWRFFKEQFINSIKE